MAQSGQKVRWEHAAVQEATASYVMAVGRWLWHLMFAQRRLVSLRSASAGTKEERQAPTKTKESKTNRHWEENNTRQTRRSECDRVQELFLDEMRRLCSPVQQAVEDRGWHLVDLAHDAHVVCDLPVRIQQHADGQLVPGRGTGEDIRGKAKAGIRQRIRGKARRHIISQEAARIRRGISRVRRAHNQHERTGTAVNNGVNQRLHNSPRHMLLTTRWQNK